MSWRRFGSFVHALCADRVGDVGPPPRNARLNNPVCHGEQLEQPVLGDGGVVGIDRPHVERPVLHDPGAAHDICTPGDDGLHAPPSSALGAEAAIAELEARRAEILPHELKGNRFFTYVLKIVSR